MADSARDQWAEWLLARRFGGDPQEGKRMVERLSTIRHQVLRGARIREGETVLDVGCGDGLIAFGALEAVGKQGKVIFSDISQDLLDHCQRLAEQMQVQERCQFLRTSAEALSVVESQSVDVVTTRSVLIYVREKPRAFEQFYRVLKPGGRISLFEPINRFAYPEPPQRFFGYNVTPVMDLTQKLLAVYGRADQSTLGDFDERDLFSFAEQAGFPEVHLELHTTVTPGNAAPEQEDEALRWQLFLKSSPNPLAPTFEEALQQALSESEAERLIAHLRPLVEQRLSTVRSSLAYLRAVKH